MKKKEKINQEPKKSIKDFKEQKVNEEKVKGGPIGFDVLGSTLSGAG